MKNYGKTMTGLPKNMNFQKTTKKPGFAKTVKTFSYGCWSCQPASCKKSLVNTHDRDYIFLARNSNDCSHQLRPIKEVEEK